MNYATVIDEGHAARPLNSRPDRTDWQAAKTDHTNSGGFCSCCGVVYPCRAARVARMPSLAQPRSV